ncbi:hypothetical protein SYNTR_1202 [Candidatus Syntrophocurvum alkaliphilum]|uniref:DUF697 domain-containing protein n=1 Tax=Candidatus Syntrophocurvum alkaliphilum TaxID=2293317 RepID=A0A6I6DAQ8_9FIRM|nr:DUF697 domain-containing protein [Candidatus Syntrophocurvum alkaliphilum]QGT99795.1 hypothetical protein SYNTR_1202 [Candidatus Syntrophocurvum alkaliphilum]
MDKWNAILKAIKLMILGILIIFFINQIVSFISSIFAMNHILGIVSTVIIIALFTILIIYIASIWRQMPEVLPQPPLQDTEDYKNYLQLIENRLIDNENLKEIEFNLETHENVDIAMKKLDELADEEIKKTAKKVFLFTSISQYGKLDGLVVFILLIKLTTKIALIYNQKPSIKELKNLYINVFATVLVVTEMDDIEIVQTQLEPFMENFTEGIYVTIAGSAGSIGALFANSVFQGAINSFLVMRVGFISKQYSMPLKQEEKITILKGATAEASKMLGSIISNSIKSVATLFYKNTTKVTSDFVYSSYDSCVSAMGKVKDKVTDTFSFNKNKQSS